MKFPSRQKPGSDLPGVSGTLRVERRTSALLGRLRPGDIAVIDHLDLDRANAEALIERGVVAVVNASQSISGRYPNLGPELLAKAGVVLLDDVGPEALARLRDGATARIHQGQLFVGDEPAPAVTGEQLGPDEIAALMEGAGEGLATQLQTFTHNTTEFLRREQDVLLHGLGAPRLHTRVAGRPVVVVARAYRYREDLRRLRRYIREQRPVLIGVDAGADVLLEAGHRPDVVVVGERGLAAGGPSSSAISDKAVRTAREVVLHTDRAGRAVGSDRLDRLGVRAHTFATSGNSEDVAMLLADQAGASLIVAVGTHADLAEFLDRQRSGLPGTFLTRLRVGPKLVDARSVPALYSGRVQTWHLLVVLLAGVVALLVAVASTPVGQEWWDAAQDWLSDAIDWLQGLFS